MKLHDGGVDWCHGPPDVRESGAPHAFHDGGLVDIELDGLARTARLTFDVPYYARCLHLPEGVRIVLTLGGVRSLRASTRDLPEAPLPPAPPGETRMEESARIKAWQALGQERSLDWSDSVRRIREDEMEVHTGAILESADGVALQLLGAVGDDCMPIRLIISGTSLRWSLSDGTPWSEEQMRAVFDAYWSAFDQRGERMRRSRAFAHVHPLPESLLERASERQLRAQLEALDALPSTRAETGIPEHDWPTLTLRFLYSKEDPRWAELRAATAAALAAR